MPRLPPALLRHAHQTSPDLRRLLPICRDLASAKNELRWIREHVVATTTTAAAASASASASASAAAVVALPDNKINCPPGPRRGGAGVAAAGANVAEVKRRVARLCARRGRGEPLQYVLGSQPFGPLEVKCRPGVLIPRPETEAYVFHLAGELMGSKGGWKPDRRAELRVVDFCTGTGCIALLLYSLLHSRFPGLDVRGFDVSDVAVSLARENLGFNVRGALLPASALGEGGGGGGGRRRPGVRFEKADIFSDRWEGLPDGDERGVDVLVSNPPYISAEGFARDTGRSVRNFEPKLALVPLAVDAGGTAAEVGCEPEDVFYARLFEIAGILRPRVMLFEVGDLGQALRVAEMAAELEGGGHRDIEIWRDWPDMTPEDDEQRTALVHGRTIPIIGSGNGRSVVIRCRS